MALGRSPHARGQRRGRSLSGATQGVDIQSVNHRRDTRHSALPASIASFRRHDATTLELCDMAVAQCDGVPFGSRSSERTSSGIESPPQVLQGPDGPEPSVLAFRCQNTSNIGGPRNMRLRRFEFGRRNRLVGFSWSRTSPVPRERNFLATACPRRPASGGATGVPKMDAGAGSHAGIVVDSAGTHAPGIATGRLDAGLRH